jgi:hypothetical protein
MAISCTEAPKFFVNIKLSRLWEKGCRCRCLRDFSALQASERPSDVNHTPKFAKAHAQLTQHVDKLAPHPMHLACNDPAWYAVAADKLLFHTLMVGSRLPVPPLCSPSRRRDGGPEKRALSAVLMKSAASYETRRSTRCSPSQSPGNTEIQSLGRECRSLRSFDGRSAAARRRTQNRREPGC